jgi:virginiamycin B lyase
MASTHQQLTYHWPARDEKTPPIPRIALLLLGFLCATAAIPAQAPKAKVVRTGAKSPGVIRPMSALHPQAVYKLAGTPDWSVVTKDAVWVSSSRVNQVSQLVPATGQVGLIAHVQLPCSGLAYGWGSVWVPSCGSHEVVRVDEKTGKATATIPTDPANSEGGITIGDGSVWLVTKPSRLVRIDPTTNAVIKTLDLPAGSENPAFGGGFVWVSSSTGNALLKIDPRTNKIASTIPVGPGPRFLTVGDGSVWTLNQGDGTISRVDMTTGKVVATVPCGIPGFGGEVSYGDGYVWATMFDFPVTQVDPKTNQPVRQWAGAGGDGLRFGLGSVWLSNGKEGTVWRIAPER